MSITDPVLSGLDFSPSYACEGVRIGRHVDDTCKAPAVGFVVETCPRCLQRVVHPVCQVAADTVVRPTRCLVHNGGCQRIAPAGMWFPEIVPLDGAS